MNKLFVILVLALLFGLACFNAPYSDGKRTYAFYCENCHMEDGSGLPPLYVPIYESVYLDVRFADLPCLIKKGKQSSLMDNVVMPPHDLSEVDMINLVNYINYKWGEGNVLNVNDIKENYKNCD